MDVSNAYSSQLGSSSAVSKYSNDYVGGVQLIEKSGFVPFKDKNPLNSTLNQIFDEFKEKTGFDVDVKELKDEFLDKNPRTRGAMSLYNSLESTFSNSPDTTSAIESFLNEKIDQYAVENDEDEDGTLSLDEAEIDETLFADIDKDKDNNIDTNEIKSNFYDKFDSLKNILNYFKTNPGTLVDTYA